MMGVDVLNLEWTSCSSRDREAASLIMNYLRHQGYKVREDSIFRASLEFLSNRPKTFFLTNSVGASENIQCVKLAKGLGLPVITSISEGNFRDGESTVSEFFWGWNREKILYEDLQILWSHRTRAMTLAGFPYVADKLAVGGAVGIDRYQIIPRDMSVVRSIRGRYETVIGVGCYDFEFVDETSWKFETAKSFLSDEDFAILRSSREAFNRVLKEAIEVCPDVLFLLKVHPCSANRSTGPAIQGLDSFPNVQVIQNEIPVLECIAACDAWFVFESTTALEAWFLEKPTGLINPCGTDFKRDELYRGSPNFPSAPELVSAIDSVRSGKGLPGFAELSEVRDELIPRVIGWADGLNHVRVGNAIIDLLERKKRRPKVDFAQALLLWSRVFLSNLRFFIRRHMRKADKSSTILDFSRREVEELAADRLKYQIAYYEANGLTREKLRAIKCEFLPW